MFSEADSAARSLLARARSRTLLPLLPLPLPETDEGDEAGDGCLPPPRLALCALPGRDALRRLLSTSEDSPVEDATDEWSDEANPSDCERMGEGLEGAGTAAAEWAEEWTGPDCCKRLGTRCGDSAGPEVERATGG